MFDKIPELEAMVATATNLSKISEDQEQLKQISFSLTETSVSEFNTPVSLNYANPKSFECTRADLIKTFLKVLNGHKELILREMAYELRSTARKAADEIASKIDEHRSRLSEIRFS